MRFKIALGLFCLVVGVASCDADSGDPQAEGTEVAEPPRSAPTEPEPTTGPPGAPTQRPPDATGQPAASSNQATERPATPSEAAPSGSAPVGTRENPLPAGSTFVMSRRIDGEGDPVALWEIVLGPTNLDATDEVLAENQFNELADGRRAVMTEVTATYVGPGSGNAWVDLNFTYLGSDGNTFDYGSDDSCGIIPNDLLHRGEQVAGATAKGNICEAVPENVIDGGMWIVAFAFTWDDRSVFVRTN